MAKILSLDEFEFEDTVEQAHYRADYVDEPLTGEFIRYMERIKKACVGTLSLMDKAPELIPYLVSETPEQLMRVLREETFPVERFMEELKDEGTAIPTHVFGHVSVN